MKFYSLQHSLNKKILGHYPQAVHAKHNCHIWDTPNFIDKFYFTKIDVEPIISNAILEKKAKLTDLISIPSIGFTLKLLVSSKLKKILEKYSENRCQFFQAPVIYNGDFVNDFHLAHPFKFDMEYIDFSKSEVIVRIKKKERGTEPKLMSVNSLKDFQELLEYHKQKMEIITINNVCLKGNTVDDFLILRYVEGGVKYIVSETLKKEIEDAGCTGIEFMPIEMKLTEWLQGGEREKIYGKA